jgi:hypothetical protein
MKKFFPDDSAFPVFHGTTAERTALLVSEPGLLVGTRFIEDTGAVNIVGSIVGSAITWLGPYTAAEVGLGGGGGGGLAPDGIVQGAGTYSATAINGYRVLVAGSANWSVTFTGGGVASIPFGAMTVGQVYPEALTAITIGTGGSALLYIP